VLLAIAVFAGLRASEIRGLTWTDIDFLRKTIHVRQRADQWNTIGSPKSAGAHRAVPLVKPLENVLKEWRIACPRSEQGLVLPTSKGRPQHHANLLQRVIYPIQKRAGIANQYSLHAFRHFFASYAIDQGFNHKQLQVLLGHAGISLTLDVYSHLFTQPEDDHARLSAGAMALVRS
jgi:integrase